MKPKLLILIIIFTVSSFALLHSCIKPIDETQNCGDSPPEYYYLSAGQKAIIPYTGYDTISMVSNTGDTIHCIGTGKQFFNTKIFEPQSHPSCAGYGTDKFYEAYRIEFVDSIKNKRIELIRYGYYPLSPFVSDDVCSIICQEKTWLVRADQISLNGAYNFVGNIEIRSKVHSNVTKAHSEPWDSNVFVLINRANGILTIQLNQNEQWELIPN